MSNYETMTNAQIRDDVTPREATPIETKYNAAIDALEDLLAELSTWERRGSIEYFINFLTRNRSEILEVQE